MVLAVGGIGMFVNFIGLVLFYKHGKLVNAFKIHIFNNTVCTRYAQYRKAQTLTLYMSDTYDTRSELLLWVTQLKHI